MPCMASIKDLPVVIKRKGAFGLAKEVWAEVGKDDVFTWGSALAYAWIFAIFPFVVFLLTLAPYLPGGVKDQAMQEISEAAYNGLGEQGGSQVVKSVREVMTNQQGGLLSFGLILALWGASGGMTMTMSALDRAYVVTCARPFIKQRLVAIGLTIGTAVLILSVLVLLPIGTAIIEHLFKSGSLGTLGVWMVNIVRYGVAAGLMFVTVSIIYYFGPCIKQKWQAISPGAIFTVVAAAIMGFGFAYYVGHFGNFNKTYGALGGAIILLLFFYLTAVVLLIGAELNSVIDFEVLGVKEGDRDFLAAAKKAEAAKGGSAKGAAASGSPGSKTAPEMEHDQGLMSLARMQTDQGRSMKGSVVKWTSFSLAGRWAWRKIAQSRARKMARLQEQRGREVRAHLARARAMAD